MNIPSTILDDIALDVRKLLTEAAIAHMDTGRRATVTLKLTVRRNTESQKREVVGRVTGTLPTDEDDTVTRKLAPMVLLSVSDDHPGQQRIA
jgi:hypothetical protein